MTHLELSNLMTDYVEGVLGADRVREVEAHLDECVPCRAMVEDVRFAIASCREVAEVEPPPWLFARIVRATIGERKRSLRERLAAWLRPALRPQVGYGLAMAIFSLSFILHAANVSLRSMSVQDVDPVRWVYRANSRGHMLFARAEKYYYDLRVVYEMQSILRGFRQEPPTQPAPREKIGVPGRGSADSSVLYGAYLATEFDFSGGGPSLLAREAGAIQNAGTPVDDREYRRSEAL